jgi:chromosome segregation ATPase
MINDDLHLGDSDGSDHESSAMDLATVADNDDSDHDLFNDNPDSLVDMALEDIAASQDVSNQIYNHGKDMKHAKRVAKKMKLKILTNKAEKAKLKQKVSELNLKLVTKEATISTLEKNCDTLTDKCNNGMMQLIEAKEENKNLSLRVLEQIKTIAQIEDGGQNADLTGLKNENTELTKQIEESKATIEQLSQQLRAATKTSKSEGEKDSNEDKLKEELAEKDKLMQTYRTTHKELVDQLQQEMSKTKDLLAEKVKEVEVSASAIANLTQEKKDLFEAVRKSSQMQSRVKALQKEIAELKAKESAATNMEKEDTSAPANGTPPTGDDVVAVGRVPFAGALVSSFSMFVAADSFAFNSAISFCSAFTLLCI